MKNLASKIHKVMLDVEFLGKDQQIGTGRYAYQVLSQEKVMEEIGAAMRKHGLIIAPTKVEEVQFTETVLGKNDRDEPIIERLVTVNCEYKVIDIHSGEELSVQSSGSGVDNKEKAIGKAFTYAYKYLLLRLFAVPTGSEEQERRYAQDNRRKYQETARRTREGLSAGQMKEVMDIAIALSSNDKDKAKGAILEAMKDLGVEKLEEVKESQLDQLKASIQEKLAG